MDASNLLKPALASGELRCIGSTTFHDYKQTFERDHALARRFQKIEVDEPSVEDTVQILHGLKKVYEDHHGVELHAARRSGPPPSSRPSTSTTGSCPDKAIDVLDEAGARDRMRSEAAAAPADHRPRRGAGGREDRQDPGADRLGRRPGRAQEPRARAAEGDLRPGPGHRGHRQRHQAVALRPRPPRSSPSAASSSPARPASARPSSPSSSPASSASSSCAST